jgi:hypothetical protein
MAGRFSKTAPCDSTKDFNSALRRVRKLNFNFQEVIVNNAIEVNKQEIAANIIKSGSHDYNYVSSVTGLSLQQVMEVKEEVEAELKAATEEATAMAKTVATKKRTKPIHTISLAGNRRLERSKEEVETELNVAAEEAAAKAKTVATKKRTKKADSKKD